MISRSIQRPPPNIRMYKKQLIRVEKRLTRTTLNSINSKIARIAQAITIGCIIFIIISFSGVLYKTVEKLSSLSLPKPDANVTAKPLIEYGISIIIDKNDKLFIIFQLNLQNSEILPIGCLIFREKNCS